MSNLITKIVAKLLRKTAINIFEIAHKISYAAYLLERKRRNV